MSMTESNPTVAVTSTSGNHKRSIDDSKDNNENAKKHIKIEHNSEIPPQRDNSDNNTNNLISIHSSSPSASTAASTPHSFTSSLTTSVNPTIPGVDDERTLQLVAQHKILEDKYYNILEEYTSHFLRNDSALVWLSRSLPSRSLKLAVPKPCRLPKATAGQGGYASAFRALGLSLREVDTKSGHWHSWYLESKSTNFGAMQSALRRRWKESPNYNEQQAELVALLHSHNTHTPINNNTQAQQRSIGNSNMQSPSLTHMMNMNMNMNMNIQSPSFYSQQSPYNTNMPLIPAYGLAAQQPLTHALLQQQIPISMQQYPNTDNTHSSQSQSQSHSNDITTPQANNNNNYNDRKQLSGFDLINTMDQHYLHRNWVGLQNSNIVGANAGYSDIQMAAIREQTLQYMGAMRAQQAQQLYGQKPLPVSALGYVYSSPTNSIPQFYAPTYSSPQPYNANTSTSSMTNAQQLINQQIQHQQSAQQRALQLSEMNSPSITSTSTLLSDNKSMNSSDNVNANAASIIQSLSQSNSKSNQRNTNDLINNNTQAVS